MHIHMIAICGAVMHNLALALHNKRIRITGSDDEIFESSRTRLEAYGLLPEKTGRCAVPVSQARGKGHAPSDERGLVTGGLNDLKQREVSVLLVFETSANRNGLVSKLSILELRSLLRKHRDGYEHRGEKDQ